MKKNYLLILFILSSLISSAQNDTLRIKLVNQNNEKIESILYGIIFFTNPSNESIPLSLVIKQDSIHNFTIPIQKAEYLNINNEYSILIELRFSFYYKAYFKINSTEIPKEIVISLIEIPACELKKITSKKNKQD